MEAKTKVKLTVELILSLFPTEDSCLEALFRLRYGKKPRCRKCGLINEFYRRRRGRSYVCRCGRFEISPMAGTILAYSKVPLRDWLWVIATLVIEGRGLKPSDLINRFGMTYKQASHTLRESRAFVAMQTLLRPG